MKFGQQAKKLFWAAANVSNPGVFRSKLEKIEEISPACRTYIDVIPVDRWAQHAYPFRDHPRYGHHTSNIAESINKEWLVLRGLPPFRLLIAVWEAVRAKFYSRQFENQSSAGGDPIKTKYANMVEKREGAGLSNYSLSPVDHESASVRNLKNRKTYQVDLKRRTCTCTHFQDTQIACRFAVAAAECLKVSRYCSPVHNIENHRKAYSGGFCFIAPQDLVETPYVKPPEHTRRPGRRRQRRIRRESLFSDKKRRRCGNCNMYGHDRRTCNGVVEEQSDGGNQQTPFQKKQLEVRNLRRIDK